MVTGKQVGKGHSHKEGFAEQGRRAETRHRGLGDWARHLYGEQEAEFHGGA